MRLTQLLFISFFFVANVSFAQNRSFKKTIEITDGDEPTVLIKTESNGHVTEELLKGEEAKKFIHDNQDKSNNLLEFRITQNDIDDLVKELQLLMTNIDKKVLEMTEHPNGNYHSQNHKKN